MILFYRSEDDVMMDTIRIYKNTSLYLFIYLFLLGVSRHGGVDGRIDNEE